MDILDKLFARAKANKKRIILPESFEERTMRAADIVLRDGLAEIVLLGNKEALLAQAKEMGLENIDKAIISTLLCLYNLLGVKSLTASISETLTFCSSLHFRKNLLHFHRNPKTAHLLCYNDANTE